MATHPGTAPQEPARTSTSSLRALIAQMTELENQRSSSDMMMDEDSWREKKRSLQKTANLSRALSVEISQLQRSSGGGTKSWDQEDEVILRKKGRRSPHHPSSPPKRRGSGGIVRADSKNTRSSTSRSSSPTVADEIPSGVSIQKRSSSVRNLIAQLVQLENQRSGVLSLEEKKRSLQKTADLSRALSAELSQLHRKEALASTGGGNNDIMTPREDEQEDDIFLQQKQQPSSSALVSSLRRRRDESTMLVVKNNSSKVLSSIPGLVAEDSDSSKASRSDDDGSEMSRMKSGSSSVPEATLFTTAFTGGLDCLSCYAATELSHWGNMLAIVMGRTYRAFDFSDSICSTGSSTRQLPNAEEREEEGDDDETADTETETDEGSNHPLAPSNTKTTPVPPLRSNHAPTTLHRKPSRAGSFNKHRRLVV